MNRPDMSGIHLSSDAFPGGTLLSAYFDRNVVRLSDRGGASGMIGDRWSDIVADELSAWPGQNVTMSDGRDLHVVRVLRLDDTPSIARIASKRKLQNADFIVCGERGGTPVMYAADAKFSVETAKSRQVSADVLQALLEVGPLITDLLPGLLPDAELQDGVFISPDYDLTRYVLGRRRGYLSATVPASQFHLVPIRPVPFLKVLEGAPFISQLAEVDGFEPETRTNLLLALYYFRLVRACIGCWLDESVPVLGPRTTTAVDLAAIGATLGALCRSSRTAWDVVDRWDARADAVRRQRETVNGLLQVPVANKDVRTQLEAMSAAADVTAPSMNRVRRGLAGWFIGEVTEAIGVVTPPVDDFPALVRRLETERARLEPQVPEQVQRVIAGLIADDAANPVVDA